MGFNMAANMPPWILHNKRKVIGTHFNENRPRSIYICEIQVTYVIIWFQVFHYCHVTFTPGNAHLRCKCRWVFYCMKNKHFSSVYNRGMTRVTYQDILVTRAVFRESFPLKFVHDSTPTLKWDQMTRLDPKLKLVSSHLILFIPQFLNRTISIFG